MVSWDGAPDWVIDRLLAEGRLPNVARMRREGAAAETVTAVFPSKTAVAHMAIFSGAWPSLTNVSSNTAPRLPRSQFTMLDTIRGFDGSVHALDPFWVTIAKDGRRALALSAAGSYPPEPDLARIRAARKNPRNFIEFSGFESSLAPGRMIDLKGNSETELTIGDTKFTARLNTNTEGRYESVTLRSGGEAWTLRPQPAGDGRTGWTPAIPVQRGPDFGVTAFRLWRLDPSTGATDLYQRAVNAMKGTESPAENERYLRAYGGFHDDPFGLYERGGFGPTLWNGGDGTAEARVVEMVRHDCLLLTNSFRYGIRTFRPNAVFHYTPMSDSAGHTWVGVMDPWSPSYNRDLAEQLWPYYAQVYEAQDAWLGEMRRLAPNTNFVLFSDHGMAGIDRYVRPNVALEQAGLLAYTAEGRIDLTRTKIVSPPWSEFAFLVNGTDRKGGIVRPEEREAVISAAERAVLGLRDPATGQALVTRTWRPEEFSGIGIGGPSGGDLYLDFAPGLYPRASRGPLLEEATPVIRNGVHGFWGERRSMHSIFFAAGPAFGRHSIPPIRQIDIVPSVARALGWSIPSGAVGVPVDLRPRR